MTTEEEYAEREYPDFRDAPLEVFIEAFTDLCGEVTIDASGYVQIVGTDLEIYPVSTNAGMWVPANFATRACIARGCDPIELFGAMVRLRSKL